MKIRNKATAFMTKGEKKFARLLERNGVSFKAKFPLKLTDPRLFEWDKELNDWIVLKRKLVIPDFFLTKYTGFCEVITSPDTLLARVDILKEVIRRRYKFTFYSDAGQKLILPDALLEMLGVKSNQEFFIIQEFGYQELKMRLSTNNKYLFFDRKSVDPLVHVGKVLKVTDVEKEQIRMLYRRGFSTQLGLAKTFDVSQALISKIISEGD